MKPNKFFSVIFIAAAFFVIGSSKASALTAGSCTTAKDCVSGQICNAGKCVAAGHQIAPNAPVVGGTGQITNDIIPGTTTEKSQIITCGRPGQRMCTLCNLIEGLNNIIHYLRSVAIGFALLAMSIGGVMYVISSGDKGMIDKGKGIMKNAAIGFVIIFASFLIIDTTINYIGSKKDANGVPTFGMNITGWGKFDCNASSNR